MIAPITASKDGVSVGVENGVTEPPAAPLVQPAAPSVVAPAKDLTQDISRILTEAKLPERREYRASADIPLNPAEAEMVVPASAVAEDEAPRLEEKADDIMSPVHTFRADVQSVVREQDMTLIKAASMESDKMRGSSKVYNPGAQQRKRRTVALVFVVMLFLGLGAAALFGVAYVAQQHSVQTAAPNDTSLIFAEQRVLLPLDNAVPANLKQTIASMRLSSSAPLGAITRVVPTLTTRDANGAATQRLATTQEFFMALGVTAPDSLFRALSDNFFFGIHTIDKNVPVLVIPVTSYDRAFAGMLAWESQMNTDLSPAFTTVPTSVNGQNGPETNVFHDDVMRNYDVRELKDGNGTVQLYYSFPTANILIIAESTYSFSEVLSRLQSGGKL